MVVIEVAGGVASITHNPNSIEVAIIDWDNLLPDSGSKGDIERAWDELSMLEQQFIETEYPEAYQEILDHIEAEKELD